MASTSEASLPISRRSRNAVRSPRLRSLARAAILRGISRAGAVPMRRLLSRLSALSTSPSRSGACTTSMPGHSSAARSASSGAVEIERDAVLAHDRERLAFEDAEIGGVAQVVVLPGVAVEQEDVEPLPRHLLQQPRPAIAGHAHMRLRHSFQREKRASTMRTSSLRMIASSASVRISAISAAGLKVSA